MKTATILIIIFLIIFLIPVFGLAKDDFVKVGTTAAQFLKVDVGARAIAMGGAFAAVANDASALYWNPAGIARMTRTELTFTYTQWIADINHSFAGVVLPMGRNNSLGLSAVFQTIGEIEQTTIDQPRGTGLFFNAEDFAFGLTYARAMTDFIWVGATGKFIYQSIWNESATTIGLDVGMLLDTGIKGVKIAMVMTNWGGDLKLDGRDLIRGYDQMPESSINPHTEAKLSTEPWPLPTNFRASLTTDLIGPYGALGVNQKNRVTAVIDVTHPNDQVEQLNLGAEYGLNEKVFFRAGYRTQADEEGLTLGAGFDIPFGSNLKFIVDYAYADFGVFNYVQHFSLGIKF